MVGCSILGCKSRSEQKIDGLTFHSFPSNNKLKLKWLNIAGRQNWQPTKYSKICSIHFEYSSFDFKNKNVRLKPDSVPTKHVHLENDTVNYMEYKIMSKTLGRRVSLRLKQGTLPHKFECQKSCKRPLQNTAVTPTDSKRAALRDKTFVEHQMLSPTKDVETVQIAQTVDSSTEKIEHQMLIPKKETDAVEATSSSDYSTKNVENTPKLQQMATLKNEKSVTAATTTPSGYKIQNVKKMVGCSIRKCKSKSVKGSFITFFPLPSDKKVAKEWLKHCGSNTTTDNGRVCSLHFTLADYVKLNPKRLKPTAIPTLNIDDKDVDRNQEKEVGPRNNLIQVKKEFGQMKTEESPFFADGSQAKTLQPERVEQCKQCKQKVKSIYLHICHVEVQPLNVENLVCGACEAYSTNVKNFVVHVLSSHATCVESMFFPNGAEFIKWKTEMEAQTHTRYIAYERSDNKKFYHCDYSDEIDKVSCHICPSILVVQEFSKGIQVHYYKTHHKHNSVAYSLSNQFKKYSISSFLQENSTQDNEIPTDDKDLYLEFKNVMKGIMVDAAKINIATLKMLLDMALEMASVVANYDEEKEEHENNNHHLTDDQITKELEIKESGKRKTDDATRLKVKRPKLVVEDTSDVALKIVNTFSLAGDAKTNEKVGVEVKKEVEDTEERDPYSSAFNDSYKDFVVKNFAVPVEGKQRLKRQVVKTKIGQYKPVSPPKDEESPKTDKDKPKILQKPKVDKPKVVGRVKPKVKAKKILKNLSPRLSLEKPIEPKYVVKEQEGDCNILILKI